MHGKRVTNYEQRIIMPFAKTIFPKIIWHVLLINLSATIISIGFNVATYGLRTLTLEEFVSSFAYSNCIGTLICFVIFYLSPRWNKNLELIRLIKVFLAIFIATFAGVILARLILAVFFPVFAKQTLLPGWKNFVFSLCMASTFGFAYYFYEISQTKLRQKELDEEKAKTLATEAQLASLESRIHPHFLFNTLNSIAALIREEPVLAEKMVEKLSALLRYSLDSNAKGLVSLEQELEITQKYLEIEKVRFADRLNYKIDCEPRFSETKIPPLSLQTLVENSIKHVVSKTSGQTEIVISVKQNDDSIEIEVCDSGTGFDENSIKENHGLDNLRKRLSAIFQARAALKIIENKDSCVNLKLPSEKI